MEHKQPIRQLFSSLLKGLYYNENLAGSLQFSLGSDIKSFCVKKRNCLEGSTKQLGGFVFLISSEFSKL